jgi:carboxyl-terminal processing protease
MMIHNRVATLLLVCGCLFSFACAAGCSAVFGEGGYERVGHVTLASLPDDQQAAIQAAEEEKSDPAARGAALWRKGQNYEGDQDFFAALAAYEELRRTKAEPPGDLEERVQWCRARITVAERWGDGDLLAAAKKMDLGQGLGLFREVARTVADNYVDELGYQKLLQFGVMNLRAALASADFAKTVKLSDQPAAQEDFRKGLDDLAKRIGEEKNITSFSARRYVREAADLAEQTGALPPGVVVSEFIFATAEHLDPYSLYLTRRMYEDVLDDITGKFVGLGVEVKEEDGRLIIVTVFEGGPAEKAGLQVGDQLVKADGVDVEKAGLNETIKHLRGASGTPVEVTVRRSGELKTFTVKRGAVEVASVRGAARLGAAKAYGYVAISSFQEDTGPELAAALDRLEKDGPGRPEGIVLDLRGNPGGLLDAAVDVCGLFLDQGVVLSTKGRGFDQTHTYRVNHWLYAYHDLPLVILMDEHSASASEIVAGALHDQHRATLVGRRSYGKGVVQTILPVEVGRSAVYLTTARYYGPNNESFHGVGIEPDEVVTAKVTDEAMARHDPRQDAALEKALEVLAAKCRSGLATAPIAALETIGVGQ